MLSPLLFFNLGAQELVILLLLGLGGVGVLAALVVTLVLVSRQRPPEDGGE